MIIKLMTLCHYKEIKMNYIEKVIEDKKYIKKGSIRQYMHLSFWGTKIAVVE